jgi:oxepin-CoA hydrolase/3-oxo-5,6-dehydrosuberyl-CoA semialdehyde dehydrogenase
MLKRLQHDGNGQMKTLKLLNYAQDRWYGAEGGLAPVESAVTGETVAETGSGGLDFAAMLDHARKVGAPRFAASPSTSARIC